MSHGLMSDNLFEDNPLLMGRKGEGQSHIRELAQLHLNIFLWNGILVAPGRRDTVFASLYFYY